MKVLRLKKLPGTKKNNFVFKCLKVVVDGEIVKEGSVLDGLRGRIEGRVQQLLGLLLTEGFSV
jgi:hypothetical protein